MSAGFSMTELMYITLGEIPAAVNFDRMPLTLAAGVENELPRNAFYVNDIFARVL